MKKSYLMFIFVIILGLLLLCGCGKNTGADESSDIEEGSDTMTEAVSSSTDLIANGSENNSESETQSKNETDKSTETDTSEETVSEPAECVHTIGYIPAKAVTCTEDGFTEGKMCSICKEVFISPVRIRATGHKWVTVEGTAPTCELDGWTDGVKCENCSEVPLKQEKIKALGHSWVTIPEKASTCTKNGYTEGIECERCGDVLVASEKLPLADHKYIVHMPKEPTCSEAGYELYQSCSACSYEENHKTTPPLGHKYNEDFVCTICNKDATEIQGLKFTLNEETNEYTLTDVFNYEHVSIMFEGHELKYPKIVIPDTYNGLPVTAIGKRAIDVGFLAETMLDLVIPSSITYIDQRAIAYFQEYINIYYLGDVEAWCKIDLSGNPFYYANGISLYFNGELVSELVVPSSVREIGNFQFSNIGSIKKITISEGVSTIGIEAFSNTGATEIELPSSITEIKRDAFANQYLSKVNYLGELEDWCTIEMGDHIFLCSVYFEENGREYFAYFGKELYFNGELVKELKIPETVTEIKKSAFYGISSIESVELSEGITKINNSAFAYCKNISKITLPKSLTEIGVDVFYPSEQQIYYSGNVQQWCSISFAGGRYLLQNAELYIGNELLTSLVIPASVIKVSDCAFAGYKHLKSVTFENGTEEIGYAAFSYCYGLESIKLPETLTKIGDNAFEYCTILSNVDFPFGLEEIGYSAFHGSGIKAAILPDSVSKIGGLAFYKCKSLKIVVIPESVDTLLANGTFYGCDNVRIYCKATQKPSGWADDWNGKCIYFWYSEEEPQENGNYWRYVNGDIHVW